MMIDDVKSCARCGKDHSKLLFTEFDNPVRLEKGNYHVWTHWSMCPDSNQPILLTIISLDEE